MWSRSVKGGRALLKPAPIGSHRPPSAPIGSVLSPSMEMLAITGQRHQRRADPIADIRSEPDSNCPCEEAFSAIVPPRSAAGPRACRGGRLPGDPAPPPLLHLAWPLRVRVRVRVCRDIAKQTPTLMNFTWADAAGGPLPYIQRHQ